MFETAPGAQPGPPKAAKSPPHVLGLHMGIALAIGTLGGLAANFSGMPMAWLIGALTACSLPGLFGRQLDVPDGLRRAGQVFAGLVIGSTLTAEIAGTILSLSWLMVATAMMSIGVAILVGRLFSKLSGCDPTTGFFAMVPGGMAEIAGFARQFGGDMSLISVSQSLRIVLIVVLFPMAVGILNGRAPQLIVEDSAALPWGWIIAVLAVAIGLSLALSRLKILNPWLFGGLIAGTALGIWGDGDWSLPSAFSVIAQLAIGTAIGTRFKWAAMARAGWKFVPASILGTALTMLFGLLMAICVGAWQPFETAFLATAPGGIAEMSLTAQLFGLAAPMVTGWQVVRIVVVATSVGPIYRLLKRYRQVP